MKSLMKFMTGMLFNVVMGVVLASVIGAILFPIELAETEDNKE